MSTLKLMTKQNNLLSPTPHYYNQPKELSKKPFAAKVSTFDKFSTKKENEEIPLKKLAIWYQFTCHAMKKRVMMCNL